MKYLSTELLEGLYSQTEKNISKVISEWQLLPEKQMAAQPAAGAWSAAQCLEHLNSYGRYYLPAIEKALAKAPGHQAPLYFKSGWLGNYFYKLMLPENNGMVKKKMRSPKDHQPALEINSVDVIQEFISQLEKLGSLLNDARSIDINAARVPISISPFLQLKLGDVFLFLTAHINRHMAQAERAIRSQASILSVPESQLFYTAT